jgi:C-terminal processing protease CtpA/Prc
VTWAPDNHRLAYVSDRDGVEHIFSYDFRTGKEAQLTRGTGFDWDPEWSPDGKRIAYFRNGGELHVLEVESGKDLVAAKGYFDKPPFDEDRPFVWSPDSRMIAFIAPDSRYFRNVEVVNADGTGTARRISFLANSFSRSLAWAADGKYILYTTSQRTETPVVARIDLILRTPRFREDQFSDLFKDAPPKKEKEDETKPPTGKTPDIVYDGIRERLSLLPVGIPVDSQRISPDGKTLLLIAEVAGQRNLYTYSIDELAKEPAVARQLTSTPGAKANAQWSPDGKDVFYLEAGKLNTITVESRVAKPVAITAEMDVDFNEEKREVFRQAWSYLNDDFYDGTFGGKDWGALKERFGPVVESAQTSDELRRVINLMIGELNSSHSGIGAPQGSSHPTTGRLGLRFDRVEYENAGRLKIAEVIALSPADVAEIHAGDVFVACDGVAIGAHTNLDELLENKIDRRVVLTIDSGGVKREVPIRPVNTATEKRLLYRQWVEHNREYVARISNGRLGYAHLIDMSAGSLEQFFLDLDAENHGREGVVIDIRNNNGGFVNAYALDVLTRKGYLNMTFRGYETAPARSILGQRSLERPTVLVVNQHSLSDAEDFTEGYRALHLGKVVGEPTAGWIIYTSGTQLIDGSSLRLPFIRITSNDGTDMEMHPRPVDVPVVRPIGESYSDRDSQLDAAVKVLLAPR